MLALIANIPLMNTFASNAYSSRLPGMHCCYSQPKGESADAVVNAQVSAVIILCFRVFASKQIAVCAVTLGIAWGPAF